VTISNTKQLGEAFSAGRWHLQRFFKNTGATGDAHWQDWSFASGQPAYDARIGDALTFTPFIASRNDALFFPPISGSYNRHLISLAVYPTASGTGQLSVDFQMYDLLGVYPLIDGDNTDLQEMDNTASLPRYADGKGVRAVLVNHVAPAVSAGSPCIINYVNSENEPQTMTVYTTLFGAQKAAWSLNAAGTSTSALYLPVDGGGIKSITDVTFSTAPGGLWAIYFVRPIERINSQAGLAAVTQTCFSVKDLGAMASFNFPIIYDGAWLGFFYLPNGSSRSVSVFGHATFAWG
jgi:hypothetical protein